MTSRSAKLLWLAICDIEDKRARQCEKERGKPAATRKAPGRLVEGQVVTNWKQALGQLAWPTPTASNPTSPKPQQQAHKNQESRSYTNNLTSSGGAFHRAREIHVCVSDDDLGGTYPLGVVGHCRSLSKSRTSNAYRALLRPKGFPYARQLIRITRQRTITATGARSTEIVYGICSLPFEQAKPAQIATWLRTHWGIENSVHWVRDVTFDEDRRHAHAGNSPHVLATICNTAINLHRLHGAENIAEACRATALTPNRRLDLLNPQKTRPQTC